MPLGHNHLLAGSRLKTAHKGSRQVTLPPNPTGAVRCNGAIAAAPEKRSLPNGE